MYEEVHNLCKKQEVMNLTKWVTFSFFQNIYNWLFRPSYTYIDLFRNPNMRRISILAILLWMAISLLFDTTVRNIANLNFNIYVSFMIATAVELPADLLSIVGLNWLGRRWSSAIPLFGCAVTMFSCAWLTGWYLIIRSDRKTKTRQLDSDAIHII